MRARLPAHAAVLAGIVVVLAVAVPKLDALADSSQSASKSGGDSAQPRELNALRTRTSKTFETSEGRRLTRIYSEPVHYRRDGRWKSVGTDLTSIAAGPYDFQNAGNNFQVRFPRALEDAPVEVREDGRWVRFQLRGANAQASVAGSTLNYAGVLPGVSLTYTSTRTGVKEDLRLAGPDAPRSFTFDTTLSAGLRPRKHKSGRIVLVDSRGRVAIAVEAPFMLDAAGARSNSVRTDLRRTRRGLVLTLRASDRWLDAPNRQWPVTVDPTVTTEVAEERSCYLEQGGGPGYCGGEELHLRVDGPDKRSVLHFPMSAIPAKAQVISAKLGLYHISGTSGIVDLHRLKTGTWLTQPPTWNSAADDNNFDAAIEATQGVSSTGWQYWYPASLVQRWVDGVVPNYGMLLKRGPGAGTIRFRNFDEDPPVLEVVWEPRGGRRDYYTFEEATLNDRMTLGVNVANGNALLQARDVDIKGTGLDLRIVRSYNALRADIDGVFGKGWNANIGGLSGVRLELFDRSVAFHDGTGSVWPIAKSASGSFTSPTGLNAKLTKLASSYTLLFEKSKETYVFTLAGRLTSHSDRNGNTLTYGYNGSGQLTTITDTQGRVTTFTYTGSRISQITDSAGRIFRYTYDGTGQLTTYTDPATKATVYGYDASGNLSRITDPEARVTRLSYDSIRRAASVTHVTNSQTDGGDSTSYTYNPSNTVVRDARGHDTTYAYDPELRVTGRTDARSFSCSWTHSANSDPTSETCGPDTTTYTYNTRNNITVVDPPATSAEQLTYPSTGPNLDLPTSRTTPEGNVWNYTYDTPGNLTSVRNSQSATPDANLTYGVKGVMTTSTDGRGNVTNYMYDTQGNLTRVTPPLPLGTTDYTYDSLSRVRTMRDGRGQTTTYTYDVLDRLTREDFSDGSFVTYEYDASGNLTRQVDATGVATDTYDRRNRVVSEVRPDGTTTHTYDGASNRTSLTDPGGAVTYEFGPTNLLNALNEPGGPRTTFSYDAEGKRTQTTYPSGVRVERQYDAADHLVNVTNRAAAGGVIKSFQYTYVDPGGRETNQRQTVTDQAGATTTYAYDALDRLTGAITRNSQAQITDAFGYTYDRASNRTSATRNGQTTSYTFNNANELTGAGSTGYTYDGAGNQTGNSSGRSVTYNAKNQTNLFTPELGPSTALAYEGSNQMDRTRVGEAVLLNNAVGVASRATAAGTTHYTREPTGELIAQRTPAGRQYFLFDGLGSIVGLTDQGGSTVASFGYSPYGEPTSASGSAETIWRFAGEQLDPTGLYKVGNRYYEPSLGGWTQQDPVLHPTAPIESNRYGYAGGNPVNEVDPSGCGIKFPNIKCLAECTTIFCMTSVLVKCPPRASPTGIAVCIAIECGTAAAKCWKKCRKRKKKIGWTGPNPEDLPEVASVGY